MVYELMSLSAEQLTERLGTCEPGSTPHAAITAEILRRQLFVQYEAVEAQKRAALAEEKATAAIVNTAIVISRNAKYMLWAVILATASTLVSLATTLIMVWPKK
jgi:hypothetical protein